MKELLFLVLYRYEHIKKYYIIIIYSTNIYTALPPQFLKQSSVCTRPIFYILHLNVHNSH